MHHITANGGELKAPFNQAIVQSPGWLPTIDIAGNWNRTLTVASEIAGKPITNGSDLQKLNSDLMIKINAELIYSSAPGSFTFGPTVDGQYVPDQVGKLLLEGKFDHSVKVIAGHNANEAGAFLSLEINTEAEVDAIVGATLVGANPEAIGYILTDLYPSPNNKTVYRTQHDRLALFISEFSFTCNTNYLARAYDNATWNYRFDIPPAVHAADIPYTFYSGLKNSITNPMIAEIMQRYFVSFVATGVPDSGNLFSWSQYGANATIAAFEVGGVMQTLDDAANQRCTYWQKATYLN